MSSSMKIYLDNCCLNRPFDNQADLRIHLEAEAVKAIITLVEQGQWTLISSSVLRFEMAKLADAARKKELMLIESLALTVIKVNPAIAARAEDFEQQGLQAFDALHLACAEHHADVLLTVDDKFSRKANAIAPLKVRVCNPLVWLNEVLA